MEKIVEPAGQATPNPPPTPLPLSHPLYAEENSVTDGDQEDKKNFPYRSVLGSWLYLATRTRPDIATAVSMLAKFQQALTGRPWKAMEPLVNYLKGT